MSTELAPLPHKPTLEQIFKLEGELLKMPQAPIVLVHRFAEGLYAREITIPKYCVLTGMIHKREHLNIISKGDITVWTEEGMKRLKAPCTLVSTPGTKRVGFAHEETVWTTIHACTERDVEKIEAEFVTNDPQYLIESQEWLFS